MIHVVSLSCLSAVIVGPRVAGPRAPVPRMQAAATADEVEQRTAIKDELLSKIIDGLSEEATVASRPVVNELVLQLERFNPTEAPARSNLLNGVWELQYAGGLQSGLVDSPTRELALAIYSAGYSAGTLLQVLGKLPRSAGSLDSVRVSITSADAGQPRVTTDVSVQLVGSAGTVSLFSNLQALSATRLREDVVEASALGQRALLPGFLARTRQLYVTYVDDELLVVRDESGTPEVLVRKEKDFASYSATQPDNFDATGEGAAEVGEPVPVDVELAEDVDGEAPSD